MDLRGVHRIHSWRSVDHIAVRGNVVCWRTSSTGINFDCSFACDHYDHHVLAAYIAEVMRGGLAALPKGQAEAQAVLGLDYAQVHASDHSATSAQDFHSGDRERGGGSVQRHEFWCRSFRCSIWSA